MLELHSLDVRYGSTQVLWGIDLKVGDGEIVAVMGPNGSGKSTVLKAIMGLVAASSGAILFRGEDITRLPAERHARCGISMVLERRRLFPMMTVRENVLMGAYSVRRAASEIPPWITEMLPIVRDRSNQIAESLSGGEQQLVAIARGLTAQPSLLLLDEPFLGLTPKMTERVVEIIRHINARGIGVLFNEQNAEVSFTNAHRGYVLEGGRVAAAGSGSEMLRHPVVRSVYLGHESQAVA